MPKAKDLISPPRFTVQLNPNLYKAVQLSAISQDRKVYEHMNDLLLLGIREWLKKNRDGQLEEVVANVKSAEAQIKETKA